MRRSLLSLRAHDHRRLLLLGCALSYARAQNARAPAKLRFRLSISSRYREQKRNVCQAEKQECFSRHPCGAQRFRVMIELYVAFPARGKRNVLVHTRNLLPQRQSRGGGPTQMHRYALFVQVVIAMALVGFADAQSYKSPPPSPPTRPTANCPFDASTVQVLKPTYFPYPASGNGYSPPGNNLQAGASLSQQMKDDISAAFANSPKSVQNDICALSGNIFIDTSVCQGGTINPCTPTGSTYFSWAYRSWNNKSDLGTMYIAIPASLWPNANANAIGLSAYYQAVLQYFAQSANLVWGRAYPLPTVSAVTLNTTITTPTPNNTTWPSVLAAMTHEIGHLKFNYTIHDKGNYGGNDNGLKNLKKCSLNNTDFFAGWAYAGKSAKVIPKDYWRQFAHQEDADGDKQIEHANPPYLGDFTYDPANPQDPNSLLYTLYSDPSQPWASFWGAWSPDEDFVETYVLNALNANVTSIPVSIGSNSYDVIKGLLNNGKPTLSAKMACVDKLTTLGQ